MSKKPSPREDALRAMREANYAKEERRGAKVALRKTKKRKPRKTPSQA